MICSWWLTVGMWHGELHSLTLSPSMLRLGNFGRLGPRFSGRSRDEMGLLHVPVARGRRTCCPRLGRGPPDGGFTLCSRVYFEAHSLASSVM